MRYVHSVVTTTCTGNLAESEEIIGYTGRMTADKAHHEHQQQVRRAWGDIVTGGRYRALDATNVVDALVEAQTAPL